MKTKLGKIGKYMGDHRSLSLFGTVFCHKSLGEMSEETRCIIQLPFNEDQHRETWSTGKTNNTIHLTQGKPRLKNTGKLIKHNWEESESMNIMGTGKRKKHIWI